MPFDSLPREQGLAIHHTLNENEYHLNSDFRRNMKLYHDKGIIDNWFYQQSLTEVPLRPNYATNTINGVLWLAFGLVNPSTWDSRLIYQTHPSNSQTWEPISGTAQEDTSLPAWNIRVVNHIYGVNHGEQAVPPHAVEDLAAMPPPPVVPATSNAMRGGSK